MKLALVLPGGVDRSGEYRVVPALLALIARLTAHHEVHVFALTQEATPSRWQLAGASIHNIGVTLTLPRSMAAILHEHRRAPFDVIQSIWSGWCGLIAVSAGKWMGIPSLVHVAGGELVALPEIGYGGRLRWRGRLCEAFVLHNADAVSAASRPIIESIATFGIRARRVVLGVDLQAWPPRVAQRRESTRPARLIHVASLNRVKDQATLLHALAALARSGVDFHVDIVGEDTLQGEIQAMAANLNLMPRVAFHGFLTQRQLRPLMEAAQVHVMASRHEAGPLAMLEAAVAGVPTVGTAVGHIAEWAPTAALAVPIGRPAELARAVERLLGDEDLRMSIAREASRRATENDADCTAREFQRVYDEILAI